MGLRSAIDHCPVARGNQASFANRRRRLREPFPRPSQNLMTPNSISGFPRLISGGQTEAAIAVGRAPRAAPDPVSTGQIPLPSWLLATALTAALWCGIVAGIRWIWLSI